MKTGRIGSRATARSEKQQETTRGGHHADSREREVYALSTEASDSSYVSRSMRV